MKWMIHEVVAPLARRIGTFAGGFLVSYGVANPEQVETLVAVFVAGCLTVSELIAAKIWGSK